MAASLALARRLRYVEAGGSVSHDGGVGAVDLMELWISSRLVHENKKGPESPGLTCKNCGARYWD